MRAASTTEPENQHQWPACKAMDGAVAARHDGGEKAFDPADASGWRFGNVNVLFTNGSSVVAFGAVLCRLERVSIVYTLCASAAMAVVLRVSSRETGKKAFVKCLVQPLPQWVLVFKQLCKVGRVGPGALGAVAFAIVVGFRESGVVGSISRAVRAQQRGCLFAMAGGDVGELADGAEGNARGKSVWGR